MRVYTRWFLFLIFSFHFPLPALPIPHVSQLSLEEKVGQVLMVHFHGQEANEEARCLIQDIHVGGIIYYNWANGLSDPLQVHHLSQGLQKMAYGTPHQLPLLIGADQEGGCVSRLKQGFTLFPGNYALGLTGEWKWGKESALITAKELKAVGVNLNFAPVVDVYTYPANPVIGIRAFSSDPEAVAKWGGYALQGNHQGGVIAALKHFPGHGDVKVDSHATLPVIVKTREELDQIELLPFRRLADQADVIMSAHLMVPALDEKECVTFSKKIIQDLLRGEFKFQGVIMTDSLAMEGILSQSSSVEEAALKSLQAGHDLILLGGKQLLSTQKGFELTVDDVKRIHQFLVEAVKKGRLSEKRLDDSVSRLLTLKAKYGLFDFTPLQPSYLKLDVGNSIHLAVAQQIAKRSLRLIKGESFVPVIFQSEPLLIVAPECLRQEVAQTSWNSIGQNATLIFFKGLSPDDSAIAEIHEAARETKRCVFFAYNTWQFEGQQKLYQHLATLSPSLLAIVVRDPLDVDYFSSANVILCTYGPVSCSLQAAYEFLTQSK